VICNVVGLQYTCFKKVPRKDDAQGNGS